MRGTILRGVGGFYYALDDDGVIQTIRAQGKLRRERLKPKVGDRVELTPGNDDEHGWILSIDPRRNELDRPPVANVDVVAVVVAAAAPEADLTLVDRMLLHARRAGIRAMLVVTKRELAPDRAEEILRQYRGADIGLHSVSAFAGEGLDGLREAFYGCTHALAGQSGAGKSTLMNALYGLSAETGGLSRKIDRGRNTTRHCELIPVEGGGMVLDTPGFSLLESDLCDPVELKAWWPEFEPMEGQCFFQPCYHASEPKCAVRAAVGAGNIDRERYDRYAAILEDMRMRWRDRYD